ncbi:hypothetical protein SDC9_155056 [bioreactor metagenome]|uniref:Uncharacterized protein n=1 Tax=bioreactor metagenome TaxID=1076179 RepID=A0A645F5B0_9ZZZZ
MIAYYSSLHYINNCSRHREKECRKHKRNFLQFGQLVVHHCTTQLILSFHSGNKAVRLKGILQLVYDRLCLNPLFKYNMDLIIHISHSQYACRRRFLYVYNAESLRGRRYLCGGFHCIYKLRTIYNTINVELIGFKIYYCLYFTALFQSIKLCKFSVYQAGVLMVFVKIASRLKNQFIYGGLGLIRQRNEPYSDSFVISHISSQIYRDPSNCIL